MIITKDITIKTINLHHNLSTDNDNNNKYYVEIYDSIKYMINDTVICIRTRINTLPLYVVGNLFYTGQFIYKIDITDKIPVEINKSDDLMYLSLNNDINILNILKDNPNYIDYYALSSNSSIYEINREYLKERISSIKKELMEYIYNPINLKRKDYFIIK